MLTSFFDTSDLQDLFLYFKSQARYECFCMVASKKIFCHFISVVHLAVVESFIVVHVITMLFALI